MGVLKCISWSTQSDKEKGMWSLRGAPRNTPVKMWGRRNWAGKKRVSVELLRKPQATFTGRSEARSTLQICPQLKSDFVPLHQPDSGCSSAGLALGQVVPGSWGQFPMRGKLWAITSGNGTSDLKEGSRKNSKALSTKEIFFYCSKHHQARFQTTVILITILRSQILFKVPIQMKTKKRE